MIVRYKYYKGKFESQFVVSKLEDHSPDEKWGNIIPMPRARLFDVTEIDQATYESAVQARKRSYLFSSETLPIEVELHDMPVKRICDQVLIAPYEGKEIWQFIAEESGDKHGWLHGMAWCRVKFLEQTLPVAPAADIAESGNNIVQPVPTTTLINPPYLPLDQRRGCFNIPTSIGSVVTPLTGNSGCMQSGCLRFGCLPLLLLVLAAMLFSLFKTCGDTAAAGENIKIIRDTVKVEVVRERIDTLKVFQVDTIRISDTTQNLSIETITLPNVQFYTNSANLVPSSVSDIQKLAEFMNKNKSVTCEIAGHTDSIGNDAANLSLSQERAETVLSLLTSMGIEKKRVRAVGKGESEPKGDNGTPEGRLMNRRVEVTLKNENELPLK